MDAIQMGALGILAATIVPTFGLLIRYLVKTNNLLLEKNQAMVKDFKETIDNHLTKQAKTNEKLTQAIRELTKEIKNNRSYQKGGE